MSARKPRRTRDTNPLFVSENSHSIGSAVGPAIRLHKKAQRAVNLLAKEAFTDEENNRVCKIAFNALRAVAFARARNAKEAMQRIMYLEAEWRRMIGTDLDGYGELLSFAVRRLDSFVEGRR